MGRQHDRAARWDLGDVVDEHHPEVLEPVDDELVVHDLVVAVHRRFEGPDHPGQRLDGHLDAGAEAPGRGEEHGVDGHGTEATDSVGSPMWRTTVHAVTGPIPDPLYDPALDAHAEEMTRIAEIVAGLQGEPPAEWSAEAVAAARRNFEAFAENPPEVGDRFIDREIDGPARPDPPRASTSPMAISGE